MRPIRAAAVAGVLLLCTTVSPAIAEEVTAPNHLSSHSAAVFKQITATDAEETDPSAIGSIDLKTFRMIAAIVALIGGLASFSVAIIKLIPGAQDNIRNLIRG